MTKDNYLVIPVSEDRQILEYQIGMLHYNPQPGILTVQKKFDNQDISLFYQLGPRYTLAEHLRRNKATDDLLSLLIKIVDILADSKSLLLHPASFKLDPSWIYLAPDGESVALLYQPWEPILGLKETLLNFIRDLQGMLSSIGTEATEIQEIQQYLEKEFANLANFRRFLAQLNLQGPSRQAGGQKKKFKLEGEKSYLPEKREKGNINLKENKEKKEDILNIRSKRKELIFFIIVQVLIALLLLSGSDYLESLGDPTVTYAGLALLLAGANILLLRRLFANNLKEVQQSKKGPAPASMNHKEIAFSLLDSYKENG